jgi:hypothetical protein
MNPYEEWRIFHTRLFDLKAKDDELLFKVWKARLADFTLDELCEASLAIAADPGDKARFRVNHLSMLIALILGKRTEAAARERDRQERQFATTTCADCFSVGLVRVPHPDFVRDDVLTRGVFLDVACACNVGAARLNAINARLAAVESDRRIIDLGQYEAMVPDWRLILAEYEDADEREHDAADLARKIDREAGPIDTQAIAERMHKL